MIFEWTARPPGPDDTLEQTVRDVRRLVDLQIDDGNPAGRRAVVAELERLERQMARSAPADGLALAAALIRWAARTDAAAWSATTRH